MLQDLHWLPIHFWVEYKVVLLIYIAISGLGSSYLRDCLLPYVIAILSQLILAEVLKLDPPCYKSVGPLAN